MKVVFRFRLFRSLRGFVLRFLRTFKFTFRFQIVAMFYRRSSLCRPNFGRSWPFEFSFGAYVFRFCWHFKFSFRAQVVLRLNWSGSLSRFILRSLRSFKLPFRS
nr:unnamed protein product [Callosobruchus analis]